MNKLIDQIITEVGTVLLGKEQEIKLALTCLFSRGHLLIQDLPGMGKTTLSHALGHALGLDYKRIQFTSDMLPADILGVSIFDQQNGQFEFHQGPVFTQLLLADEINRTTPKTQSALLEAMEEKQVTIEGETRKLDENFFVIATQNPVAQAGTFPLPESQLDRFLMRISLGYPNPQAERELFMGLNPREKMASIQPCLTLDELQKIQQAAQQVFISEAVLDYVQAVVKYTRTHSEFAYGVSPRGALALVHCAKTWAFIDGRNHVLPEDVQTVMLPVLNHRVRDVADYGDTSGQALVERVLNAVDVVG
ncbi:MAG: MoxR family ATPase [Pseudomonadales bacterium]